ncbi:MAG: GNAT family N-acetyltransferase [Pseudomonadota bacterium]
MNQLIAPEIEVFSPEYQDGVLDLILGIQQKEFQIAITAEDQPDLRRIQNFYQIGKGNFWVAVLNKKVIGTISLLDIGNDRAALRKMFVHENFRGGSQNIASRLLATLLNWAESTGIKEIFLGTTPVFLAAHRFYEKNGFHEIDKGVLPGTFPVMKVDTRFYRYVL